MARGNAIKVLRTTRANLNTQAGASALLAGEPYLITDENRLAVGLTTTTYQDFAKASEALPAASQAEQESGSATDKTVTPGRQRFHPSAAKAWVRFNGSGTVAIEASYNVSSITDNGVGDYTVNFTTAFSTANYSVGGAGKLQVGSPLISTVNISGSAAPTAGACRLDTFYYYSGGSGSGDFLIVCAQFFGDQ